MRSATRAIRVCVVVESVIYGLRRRPVLNRYCDHATMAAAIAIVRLFVIILFSFNRPG